MKIMKERENERERLRDTEKIADKRSARQLERERDDFKMKLVWKISIFGWLFMVNMLKEKQNCSIILSDM